MRAFLLPIFLVCAAAAVHAQTAPAAEPGRRVTVNLRKGEPVSGAFLSADSKSVSVESDGERLTLDLDNVASLVFARPEPDSAAAKAVEALKSLSTISRPSANAARDYRTRFLEVKSVVDDQLPLIPEGDLREAVGDVLKAFELASEILEQASRSKPSEEAAKMTNDALGTTMSNARKRLEQAEALLLKQR
ncbi:MAG: hypothetical protein ABW250_22635 [Pyrinomonadaceae bacterium]